MFFSELLHNGYRKADGQLFKFRLLYRCAFAEELNGEYEKGARNKKKKRTVCGLPGAGALPRLPRPPHKTIAQFFGGSGTGGKTRDERIHFVLEKLAIWWGKSFFALPSAFLCLCPSSEIRKWSQFHVFAHGILSLSFAPRLERSRTRIIGAVM